VLVIKGRSTVSATNGLVSQVKVISPTSSGQTDASRKVGLYPNAVSVGDYTAINKPGTLIGLNAGPFNVTAGVNDLIQLSIDGFDIAAVIPSGVSVPLNSVVTAINDSYISVASASDIATYTANVIALSNELRSDYNAHRISTVFHVNSDTTNVIVAPVAVTLADSIALLNDVKAKFNLHLVQATIHQLDDTFNGVTAPDASDLQTAVHLANALKSGLNLHLVQRGVHGHDDITNALTPAAAPVVIADTYPILNDIKAKFNLHRVQAGSHISSDTVNIVSAADATDSATAQTLANAIKSAVNAHYVLSSTHIVNDVTNTITSPDSVSDPATITLTAELQTKYPAHLAGVQGMYHTHGTFDTTNSTSASMVELIAQTGLGLNAGKLILKSRVNTVSSQLTFKTSSTSSDVLGFTSGASAQNSRPTAANIATALNASTLFAAVAVSYTVAAAGLGNFLMINSRSVGNTSSVSFTNVANTALVPDTGLGITPGVSGAVGENAQSGFSVTSSAGSLGSAGTGFPGQTYTDVKTGLRFTILPTTSGDYSSGGSFTLVVSQTFIVDAGMPFRSIPGVETTVFNTNNMAAGTTATLNTYKRSGSEPAIGDVYYVSYEYAKNDTSAQLYSDNKKIVSNFGPATPDYPLSLAARIAQLNGAPLIGLKQVLKESDTGVPSLASYKAAIDEMRTPISGSVKPDVIVPLSTDPQIFAYVNQHCIQMSTPRNEGERTAIVGVAAGISPSGVSSIAQSLQSELTTVTYPDSYIYPVSDDTGNTTDQLIDASYMAAAIAGATCNPGFDVATPWTRRQIAGGFKRIARLLDPTEANQVAVNGVTIVEQSDSNFRIRHGLTTNMETVLTRTPSVTLTVQYVQQTMRRVLDPYIGQKLTGSLIKSSENAIVAAFNAMIEKQIVSSISGIEVAVDENDVTLLRASAIYVPVFPLEYILCTMNVKTRA
jgi:hypothetical protein